MKISLLWMSLLAPAALHATLVYSDTTTDTLNTVFYSTGPYVEIGDQIALASTQRSANSATTQFFNNGGSAGTFDATVRFFQVGGPVGSQIGGSFTTTGNSIAAGDVLNVSWALGGVVLPDNLIFTVSVSNLTAGLDLGLDLFEPPTVGSSSNKFFIIATSGPSYSQGSQGNNQDNIFFSLDASPGSTIPEPGTMLLTLLALPAFALARKRLQ
jgi:hypothetical protein